MIAGGLVANVLALDNTVIDSYLTNHLYCPARYAAEGFERNDIVRVSAAVYIDNELDEESRENCSEAASDVWAEYLKEFGISIHMSEPKEIAIPRQVYLHSFEAISSDYDMAIVFTNKKCWLKNDSSIGYADPTSNVVFVYSEYYSSVTIKNILIHEIGHLFYAGHTEGENCYMNRSTSPGNPELEWCDETISTIRMFKHKIW